MANTYVTLEAVKGPSGAEHHRLWRGRQADGCDRGGEPPDRPGTATGTSTQRGRRGGSMVTGTARLLLPDLVSVEDDGVRTDDGRDGTFGTAWDASEYVLLPRNADPEESGSGVEAVHVDRGLPRRRQAGLARGARRRSDSGRVGMVAPDEARGRDGRRGCGRGGEGGPGVERIRRVGGANAADRRGAALRPGGQRRRAGGGQGSERHGGVGARIGGAGARVRVPGAGRGGGVAADGPAVETDERWGLFRRAAPCWKRMCGRCWGRTGRRPLGVGA